MVLAALGLVVGSGISLGLSAASSAPATEEGAITLSMSVKPGQPVPMSLIRAKASKQYDGKGARGGGIDVAIIDSGITPVRGLDQPGKVIYGPDLSNEGAIANLANLDTFGHGTHLAGIIAGNDGDQVLGIAPESRLVSLKVAGATGETHVAQVIAAIDWVVEHKNDNGLNIRVLNLSLGVPDIKSSIGDPLSAAVERAWKNGIVVVAAAGNRGNTIGGVDSPAVSPYVIAVGATESYSSWGRGDTVPSWSSGGNSTRTPDVLAPGRSIMSFRVPGSFLDQKYPGAAVGEKYFVGSGTSQSAAVQSGYVAALLSRNPQLTPDQVKYMFTRYAKDMVPGTIVDGFGKINPKATARQIAKAGKARAQKFAPALTPGQGAPASNNWTGGSWNGASWSGGTWSGASWSGASWSGASWSGASWSGASWSSASWSGASWSGASWSGASWSGASWSGASWSGASWSGASWSGASWSSVAWADVPKTAIAQAVITAEDQQIDAVLEQEDQIYDRIDAVDGDLVDDLLSNEDELYETLLTDSDAIVETLLSATNPVVDPSIVSDVALVDAVIDQVTEEAQP
jgi:serine protease AprX